jgi:hypothetical protein
MYVECDTTCDWVSTGLVAGADNVELGDRQTARAEVRLRTYGKAGREGFRSGSFTRLEGGWWHDAATESDGEISAAAIISRLVVQAESKCKSEHALLRLQRHTRLQRSTDVHSRRRCAMNRERG